MLKAKDLAEMSVEELRELNKRVCAEIRHKEDMRSRRAVLDFQVGDAVEFTLMGRSRVPYGAKGTVTGFGQKRLKVDFGQFGTFNTDATVIRKVG